MSWPDPRVTDNAAFVPRQHDHGSCVDRALDRAEHLCVAHGARLTELRRQVLKLVWQRHEPIGAYELLEELKAINGKAAPPTIYRALDFLIEQGLVHRIESLNAFVGCPQPEQTHAGQFLICARCGSIGELDDPGIREAIVARAASVAGFAVERQTIELTGTCAECRRDGRA
jgi:Fur family zinc uptake transcriptional regulator